jgi:hypothetical protein
MWVRGGPHSATRHPLASAPGRLALWFQFQFDELQSQVTFSPLVQRHAVCKAVMFLFGTPIGTHSHSRCFAEPAAEGAQNPPEWRSRKASEHGGIGHRLHPQPAPRQRVPQCGRSALPDGAFHLQLHQAVQFDAVLSRQFLRNRLDEAIDDQRVGLRFADAA